MKTHKRKNPSDCKPPSSFTNLNPDAYFKILLKKRNNFFRLQACLVPYIVKVILEKYDFIFYHYHQIGLLCGTTYNPKFF